MRIILAFAILWICHCPVLAQPMPPEPDMKTATYVEWVDQRSELWQEEVVGLEVAGEPHAKQLATRIASIRQRLKQNPTRTELHQMVVRLEWDLEAAFNALDDEQRKVFFASR